MDRFEEIKSDQDLLEVQKEITRLNDLIYYYKKKVFEDTVKKSKKLKLPENVKKSPVRYDDSNCSGIGTGRGGQIKADYLPIIKQYKKSKTSKGTAFILYEKRTNCYLSVYIKDNEIEIKD